MAACPAEFDAVIDPLSRPLALLLLLLFAASPAWGANREELTARLKEVQAKIAEVQARLEADRGRLGKLEGELRRTERQIGAAVQELRRIDAEQETLQSRLKALRARRAEQRRALAGQRRALAAQIRSAYLAGREAPLKLLLNQDDPAGVGRLLVYFDYLNRARAQRIAAVKSALQELARTEEEIAARTAALERARLDGERRRAELVERKAEREKLLTALRREIHRRGRELESLRGDEQQLQELLASLAEVLADIPGGAGERKPFAELKGRLAWPVAGRLEARFGQSRGQGQLKWRGVLIGTREGSPVHAVSHGRVAFADWMRGFGLLLIIDHGDGYMSLYGHNQGLYKTTGDWVEAGEVIAVAGSSGGLDRPGLYFEIRRNGRPVDPAIWCRRPLKVADGEAAGAGR